MNDKRQPDGPDLTVGWTVDGHVPDHLQEQIYAILKKASCDVAALVAEANGLKIGVVVTGEGGNLVPRRH